MDFETLADWLNNRARDAWKHAAMADTEIPDERPKCGYNTSPDPASPTPCGSEKALNRVTVRSGESPGIVCGDHRIKVWTHHDVLSIEPLDKTTTVRRERAPQGHHPDCCCEYHRPDLFQP